MERRFVGVIEGGRPDPTASTPRGFPPSVEGVHYARSAKEFSDLVKIRTDLLVIDVHGWRSREGFEAHLGVGADVADIEIGRLQLDCRFLVLVACYQGEPADSDELFSETGASRRAERWARVSGAERILASYGAVAGRPAAIGARRIWNDPDSWLSSEAMLARYENGRRIKGLRDGLPYVWDASGRCHRPA